MLCPQHLPSEEASREHLAEESCECRARTVCVGFWGPVAQTLALLLGLRPGVQQCPPPTLPAFLLAPGGTAVQAYACQPASGQSGQSSVTMCTSP